MSQPSRRSVGMHAAAPACSRAAANRHLTHVGRRARRGDSDGALVGSYGFFPFLPGVNAITAPSTISPIPTAMPGGNHEPTLAATVTIPINTTTIWVALLSAKPCLSWAVAVAAAFHGPAAAFQR